MASSTVYGYDNSTAQDIVNAALQGAQTKLAGMTTPAYPGYTGNQKAAPVNMDYGVNYTANAPMQQVGGLLGGDYDALQQALIQPIQQQYQRGLLDMQNVYGSSGLYGSGGQGMMDDATARLNQSAATSMNDAMKNRYALQLQDMSQQQTENKNLWGAGLADADRAQTYDTNKFQYGLNQANANRDFANSQIDAQQAYNLAARNDALSQQQNAFANQISLASGANTNAAAQLQAAGNQYTADQSLAAQQQLANAQQYAANQAANAASTSGWLSGAGGLLGGLLSGAGNAGSLGNLFSWGGSSNIVDYLPAGG